MQDKVASPIHLSQMIEEALEAILSASHLETLEELRVKYLGKKGMVSLELRSLGQMDPEERKIKGEAINSLKNRLQQALDEQKERLEMILITERLARETVDISQPVRFEAQGSLHPISHVMEEVIHLFSLMGFSVAEGPSVEDDFHNFTALNIPAHHPAREMQDTFYLANEEGEPGYLLRTHTSPVQIRTMKAGKPPFRFIAPGRVYRSDSDLTHTPMFHQIEGLYIDTDIHMGHLKGCLNQFLSSFFELDNVPLRFRPSFFPFTEPSAEVDIGCSHSKSGIVIGQGNQWLEILGCGMVHPNVLRNIGVDPNYYQGFAFGIGIERLAMLKYGISDLRTFFDSDQRWLNHYRFDTFDIPSFLGGLSR